MSIDLPGKSDHGHIPVIPLSVPTFVVLINARKLPPPFSLGRLPAHATLSFSLYVFFSPIFFSGAVKISPLLLVPQSLCCLHMGKMSRVKRTMRVQLHFFTNLH